MSYTALLTDTCRVVRRTQGTFDPISGTYTPTEVELYTGECRIDSLSGAARVRVGEEAVIQAGYWVFLPLDAVAPQPEDVVVITASEDLNMVGRELVVKRNDANFSPVTSNGMRALLVEDFEEGP